MKGSLLQLGKAFWTGVINTGLGYVVIFGALYLGVEPVLSNVLGFAVGLITSFFLNKYWVMQSSEKSMGEVYRFLVAFGIAYSLNLAALYVFVYPMGLNPYGSQILAGLFYFFTFFLLNKFYVFRSPV